MTTKEKLKNIGFNWQGAKLHFLLFLISGRKF